MAKSDFLERLSRDTNALHDQGLFKAGVTYENTSSTEPLVVLRYFGPEVNPDAPNIEYQGSVKL